MNRHPITCFKKNHKYYPVKPENIEKSRLSHLLGIRKAWKEGKIKITRYGKGKTLSEEHKKKLSLAKKGKPRKWKFSKESLEKIRNSKLGNKNPMYGKPSSNRGKRCSIEVRKKISEMHKGKHFSLLTEFKRTRNDNDKILQENKLRHTLKYRLGQEKVFKRDLFHCQICHKHCGKDIVAHHKKSFTNYPKYRYSVKYGITLCRKCHFLIHHKKQFPEYYQN